MAATLCSPVLKSLNVNLHLQTKKGWRDSAHSQGEEARLGYAHSGGTVVLRLAGARICRNRYVFPRRVLYPSRCSNEGREEQSRVSSVSTEDEAVPEEGKASHNRSLMHNPGTNDGFADFGEGTNGASAGSKDEVSTREDSRLRVEVVVEAAEKGIELVAETVEVAAVTVAAVGEMEPPLAMEAPLVDQAMALKTVGFWVSAAVVFGTAVGFKEGTSKASEFFAGYLLEQSLSVDNLFVFVLIFNYFRVPSAYQSRVLTYGIAGAVVFRALMIGLGIASLQRFEGLNLIFAAILIFSAVKLFMESEEEEGDLSQNFIVKLCRQVLPVTPSYDGNKFLTVVDGTTKATPLLLTLIVVELSDIAFAVDSIPAVFGVTRDPFIVFSSNIFAILGLRSFYTIISTSMAELQYLQPAVGAVLGFIGSKMIAEFLGFHVSTEVSLGVVAAVLGAGIALSLKDQSKDE